ncbi:MAG: DUF1837 domain-containing protein [Anaeroplasma sp.]
MNLCYSTVFQTLKPYVCSKPEVKSLITALWTSTLQMKTIIKDDENSYKYHINTEIPNKIKTKVKETPIKKIKTGIYNSLVPILKKNNLIEIIKTINALLKYDENIRDDDFLCENPLYTKKEFLIKKTWEFEEYLSIILKYVFTNDNELNGKLVEERINFAKSKIDEFSSISIIPFGSSIDLPIFIETSRDRFINTFKEIYHHSYLNLHRDNQLKIFIVDIVNNRFDYKNIKKLYKYFLADYILSKNEKFKYEDQEELQLKFYDAIKKIPNRAGFKESILGNLLLYTFLEQVLNAPKLFNCITLSSTNAKSESVHMLNIDGRKTKLIFGTSEILSDLNIAITNAFNKIKLIESSLDDEKNILMDYKLLNSEFDEETANLIKDMVIPSKSTIPTENAFSIFIGYSLEGVDKSLDDKGYFLELEKKLISDIEISSSLIKKHINDLELYGYSFYIYFVPFNKAELDKLSIVEV